MLEQDLIGIGHEAQADYERLNPELAKVKFSKRFEDLIHIIIISEDNDELVISTEFAICHIVEKYAENRISTRLMKLMFARVRDAVNTVRSHLEEIKFADL